VRRLERFRYGVGVYKMDYALDSPVPWKDPNCQRVAGLHLGGTFREIAAAEHATFHGQHPERPFVLVAQASPFDPTRAPAGKATVWAYCHVPHGSTVDMSERITAQFERFAPGFRDRILAVSRRDSAAVEAYNPNYIGGDINGGVQDWRQFFTARCCAPCPIPPQPAHLSLLVLHPTRRRRARHVRLSAARAVLRASR
jgi:phytoene dehydrogenase-like protein